MGKCIIWCYGRNRLLYISRVKVHENALMSAMESPSAYLILVISDPFHRLKDCLNVYFWVDKAHRAERSDNIVCSQRSLPSPAALPLSHHSLLLFTILRLPLLTQLLKPKSKCTPYGPFKILKCSTSVSCASQCLFLKTNNRLQKSCMWELIYFTAAWDFEF